VEHKITPYKTRTGIEIGRFYERRQQFNYSYDMELLQLALLNESTFLRKEKLKNIGYFAGVILTILCLVFLAK
jgi:uncharacterized membrane protein